MSQFGADIFDDDSKPPTEPPTSGEPPKKRARKPARKKTAAAEVPEAAAPEAAAPRSPEVQSPEARSPEPAGEEQTAPKKGRRKPAAKRSKTAAETPADAAPAVPSERVHDDLGDVLFPARGAEPRKAAPPPPEAPRAPAEPRPPQREPVRAVPIEPVAEREPLAEPAEHEGGPPRAHFDDDEGRRRGRRRGRRGRRGARDDDRPEGAGFASDQGSAPPREDRAERGADFAPATGDEDPTEGGAIPTHEPTDAPTATPQQDPFARRQEAPRHGRDGGHPRDRHREGPRRDGGDRPAHGPRGPHGRDDRREPPRDDRRFDRRHDEAGFDDEPPQRLPRRDLATARRAPALPTPAAPRRTAVLVDVAALMQQARDCGGELSFRRLRKALLGHDHLVLGLAFVTPDVPPSGRGALAAAGFALRECADAAAASAGLLAATADVPADAERLVLAGLARGTAPAGGPAAERAGFRTAVDGDGGDLLLGADCMFVP